MAEGTASAEALVSVRVVHIDHYMQALSGYSASAPFQAAWLTHDASLGGGVNIGGGGPGDNVASKSSVKVPVIRIFGTTPGGQHCCVHIHGLRPYLHVIPPTRATRSPHALFEYATSLRVALETALRAAFGSPGATGGAGIYQYNNEEVTRTTMATSPDAIADIQPVSGRSIYGFIPDYQIFLKIFVYVPSTITRIANLVTRRALPSPFDEDALSVHSAHIPFVLQFLTDFALAGMDFVHFSSCKFRQPLPPYRVDRARGRESTGNAIDVNKLMSTPVTKRVFNDRLNASICPSLFWPFHVPKRSTSPVEFDAFANDILNPRVKPVKCHPFVSRTLVTLWQEERLRTGALPPRIPSPIRPVRAGAHLSPKDTQELLREVLFPSDPADDERFTDALLDNTTAGRNNKEQDVSQSIPSSSNVWNYIDASFPDEPDLSRVPSFEEAPFDDNRREDDGDDGEDADQTWKDIADCTQHVRKPAVSDRDPDYGGSPSTTRKGRFNSMDGLVADLLTTPFRLRSSLDAATPKPVPTPVPTPSQRPVRFLSTSTKPPTVSTILENLPPLEWLTPFYSIAEDHMRANLNGAQVVVRRSGAQGFPPFPLPFQAPSVPHQPIVTYLTPVRKPPTLSVLRSHSRASNIEGAASSGLDGLSAFMFARIDSAGRRIRQRQANSCAISLTPDPAISQTTGPDCDMEDLLGSSLLENDADREEEFSDNEEHPPSVMRRIRDVDETNDSADSVVIARPLSPKYDETFQSASIILPSGKLLTSTVFALPPSFAPCLRRLYELIT